jgi:hypothetical protein
MATGFWRTIREFCLTTKAVWLTSDDALAIWLVSWLEKVARQNQWPIGLHTQGAAWYSDSILVLPATSGIPEMRAFDRVEILQELENAWNDQEPQPEINLILKIVPTRDGAVLTAAS